MIVMFLFAWLFAIPIFALEIAKTGKCYKDIITSLLLSRQDCQLDYKSLFNTLRVHDLFLKFGWIVKKHRASFDPFDKLRAGKLRTGRAWSIG
jgi:hypothetical protein